MKAIFLDIDGVVNCARTKERFGGYIGIDPIKAARVKRIIAETGCEVVLSSTWRLDLKSRNHVKEKVCNFIDVTVSLPGNPLRGHEVQQWVATHPELTKYAILDDEDDFLEGQPLFRTSFYGHGLTDDIADAVIKYLNEEPA